MDTSQLIGKTALVTGAASGIGRATALAFAQRGADLVICDVNEVGLGDVAAEIKGLGRDVFAERVDVGNRGEMEAFAASVHRRYPAVDILTNNAGVGLGASFQHTTLEDWEWILGINVWGVILGCHFFLPAMVERGRGGHVVIVSSAAGFMASEALSAYSTTKFAVFGLAEALRDELKPTGIGVTAVCPGLVNTPIVRASPMRGPEASPEAREWLVDEYERRGYGPERVAEAILKAIARNRAVAPVTLEAHVFYYLKRLVPGLLARIQRAVGERMRRRMLRQHARS
jgi:NAD(P)-dependent dehydrogenase (short-subunit alcohol dehydrogenase family)